MMKKTTFGKFMAIAMVFAGFSLTSCDKTDNAIIDGKVWVKPEVQLVDGGAVITGSSPADINRMLGRVRQNIMEAAQKGEKFTIDIQTTVLNASTGDNTLNIAAVTGGDIVLKLPSNIITDTPLTIQKQGVADDATATGSDNKLEIDLPASASNLDLNLNFPATTVTLKGGTVDELTALTAWNTLIIESGVTINWLKMKGGRAEVKEGGKVIGYVRNGDEQEFNNTDVTISNDGVEPVGTNYGWDVYYKKNDTEKAYYASDLRIVKGKAAYAIVNISNGKADEPFKKITIADGGAIKLSYNSGYWDYEANKWVNAEAKGVKLIEGLGNKTAKIYGNRSTWSGGNNVTKLGSYLDLKKVNELKNVTVDGTVIPENAEWDDNLKKYVVSDITCEFSYIYLGPNSTDCDFISKLNIDGSVKNGVMSKVTNCNLTCPTKTVVLDWGTYTNDYNSQIGSINAINSKLTALNINSVSPECESSTFKTNSITFTNYYISGNSAAIKSCKFEAANEKNYAYIYLPYQTASRSSFNFTFDTCDFGKGFLFSVYYEGSKPWLDKDGKPVTKGFYWHELEDDGTQPKYDANGNYIQKQSTNEDDVPKANKANGKNSWWNGYWEENNENGLTENGYYKDYKGIITFNNTKIDGKAITKDTEFINNVASGYNEKGEIATQTRFVIGGVSYKAVMDSDTKKWFLVAAE